MGDNGQCSSTQFDQAVMFAKPGGLAFRTTEYFEHVDDLKSLRPTSQTASGDGISAGYLKSFLYGSFGGYFGSFDFFAPFLHGQQEEGWQRGEQRANISLW